MLFKNILVPFDNSRNSLRALNKAIALANLTDAKVTLVHVISYQKTIAKIVGPYKGTLLEHVEDFLSKAQAYCKHEDVKISTKILYGQPAKEILELMKKMKFDIVVMGRRGTTHLTGPSLGSVSNALIQNSTIPVLVVN